MRRDTLSRRLAKVEALAGDGKQHEHPLKLYRLGAGEPEAAWLAEQAACAGCRAPQRLRHVMWPESARAAVLGGTHGDL